MKGLNNFMGQENTIDQLKKVNWFDELPDDMLAVLAQKVTQTRFERKMKFCFTKAM